MNNTATSTIICSVQPFAESWVAKGAAMVAYGIGVFGSLMWTRELISDLTNPYKYWTIFSILRAWIKALVCLYVSLHVGMDLLQIWIKCSPLICLLNNISKSIIPVVVGLLVTCGTILKCYVLCYKRAMLEINDSKVSKYVVGSLTLLAVSLNAIKFIIESKPTFQQIGCMGYYDESWEKLPKRILTDSIIQFFIVLIHIILPVPIYMAKRREELRDKQQRANSTNPDNFQPGCRVAIFNKHLSELFLNYFIVGLIFINYSLITKLHRTNPCDLDQQTAYIFCLYFFTGNPLAVIGVIDLIKFLSTIVSLDEYYQSNPNSPQESQVDQEQDEASQNDTLQDQSNASHIKMDAIYSIHSIESRSETDF